MQFDDQQQNVDPAGQDNLLDPMRQGVGERVNDTIDEFGNRIPGGQQHSDQPAQAAGQGLDTPQQQRQQGMGGLGDTPQQQGMGGLGDMLGDRGNQPAQGSNAQQGGASAAPNSPSGSDPNNPYGNVDDIVADYGNTQTDQGQQGVSNV